MLHLLPLEELEGLLLEIPPLVEGFTKRDPHFPVDTQEWLDRLTNALKRNRLSAAAGTAVMQGNITAATRGVLSPDVIIPGQPTRAKGAAVTALRALERATTLTQGETRPIRARVNDAQLVARALLSLARAKGLLPQASPRRLLEAFEQDPEARPMLAHLIGLVGTGDALILIDRASAEVT